MTASPAITPPLKWLKYIGILNKNVNYQLSPEELVDAALENGQGVHNDTGALIIKTGQFTGRSHWTNS